jgi:hypothetical protein
MVCTMANTLITEWFELIKSKNTFSDNEFKIPFECSGNVLIIHSNKSAYAQFYHNDDVQAALSNLDMRLLENSDPALADIKRHASGFDGFAPIADSDPRGGPLLGDWISRLLARLGFSQCSGCSSRQSWLNRFSSRLRMSR